MLTIMPMIFQNTTKMPLLDLIHTVDGVHTHVHNSPPSGHDNAEPLVTIFWQLLLIVSSK